MAIKMPSSVCRLGISMVLIFLQIKSSQSSQAYFNGSSQANLTDVISLESGRTVEFSFRSCSSGVLLEQTGASGDWLQMDLLSKNNGTLKVSWVVNTSQGGLEQGDIELGDRLAINKWFRVMIKNLLGEITLSIIEGRTELHSLVLSNNTFRRYLWDIDLTSGTPLRVGHGYTGCILGGPQVGLQQGSGTESNVDWTQCSSSAIGDCVVGTKDTDDCWSFPCKNGGSCRDLVNNYVCECTPTYNGDNCENFIGNQGCNTSPCLNGATCESLAESDVSGRNYKCSCAQGFTGNNCQLEIDECASSPCYTGQCLEGTGNFTCNCTGTGYTGTVCENDIDECLGNPCKNNATCSNNFGAYTCACLPGFFGDNCQGDLDECVSSPCQNGGTCHNEFNKYRCECVVGFTGINCEVNIDDCAIIACPVNTFCQDLVNNYTCICNAGFTGDGVTCEDIDECASNPCMNGTCNNLVDSYSCDCTPGFTGTNCGININECEGAPCNNGATCTDLVLDYRCQCVAGYTDKNCSTNINECDPDPCKNGATCIDKVNGYQCNCTSGWEGDNCDVDINECEVLDPCLNGATCNNHDNLYTCACVLGFTGTNCETNIDDCTPTSCNNNGTCIDGVNSVVCNCTDEWMGDDCSTQYDACSFTPCLNGATCNTTSPSKSYTCQCVSGFNGATCENNIDDCASVVCPTGQHCIDLVNNYTCQCPAGYTGVNCSVDINECESSPCQNGATCVDGLASYTCLCLTEIVNLTSINPAYYYTSGWQGKNCDVDIDECVNEICIHGHCFNSNGSYICACESTDRVNYPIGRNCERFTDNCMAVRDPPACKNGGSCSPIAEGYDCHCTPGWEGERCEGDIDECAVYQPCQNNATCTHQIANYTCACAPGWAGVNCTINIDECLSDPCNNGGQCIDMVNRYADVDYTAVCNIAQCHETDRFVCNCTDTGFNGTFCDNNIDDCASSPCIHGSTCQDLIKDYNCSCYHGYEGKQCEVDINECDSTPCLNGATCLQKSNQTLYDRKIPRLDDFSYANASGYICMCAPGYTGVNCETDIDECQSNPCKNDATCLDEVAQFRCACARGWKGVTCMDNIDECVEAPPCVNNAKCTDLIGDYSCTCAKYDNKLWGGKNCSVELTGCYGDANKCLNNATCNPFLVGGTTDVHNSSCTCIPGYAGYYCDYATTVSLNGTSSLVLPSQTSTDVSLRFRTTLQQGVLFFNQPSSPDEYCFMEIYESKLSLACYSNGTLRRFSSQGSVNDAQWYKVSLNVIISLDRTAFITGRLSSNDNTFLETISGQFISNSSLTWELGSDNKIGDSIDSCQNCTQSMLPFVGCMQDITYKTSSHKTYVINPANYTNQVNTVEGCTRVEQCNPDPCNGNGGCRDDWIDFTCTCHRPYVGTTCNYSTTPATFGSDGNPSVVSFTVPESDKETLKTHNTISMFVRSRSQNATFFYLGGDPSGSAQNNTFISLQLLNGELNVQLRLSETIENILVSGFLADGQRHFVSVIRRASVVSVEVDSKTVLSQAQINATYDLNAAFLTLGGLPGSGSVNSKRRRRAVSGGTGIYQGTLLDVRINGKMLPTSPLNVSDPALPPSYSVENSTNVEAGEISVPQCPLQPCRNNATCSNKFWNDFSCLCPDGYKGKDCSVLDFCMSVTCPSNATCNDLEDGYECATPVTFNDTRLTYGNNLNFSRTNIEAVTFTIRTRKQNQLLLLIGNTATKYVKVSITTNLKVEAKLDSMVVIDMDSGLVDVLDGEEHQVTVNIMMTEVSAYIDGKDNKTVNQSFSSTFENVLDGGKVYVGGDEGTTFKGCMDELRIGGYLVPFFDDTDLMRNRSQQGVFYMETSNPQLQYGCHGDPVCMAGWHMCDNNSTCKDVFDKYECDCLPGFNGSLCENNIDECATSACENGATCVDGIANYTCACVAGFTGWRCETDIDECEAKPCYNNGTCIDQVNGYECNCTANYTGSTCLISIFDTCANSVCLNGATCQDLNVTKPTDLPFKCTCAPGTYGERCENMIDYCEDGPCDNGATCVSNYTLSDKHYICNCVPGYTDFNCSTNIDDCANSPCIHGQCTDLVNGYNCTCNQGWEGFNCSQDIDECNTTQPCLNSGQCTNTDGSYLCNCADTGYKGPTCADDVNECDLQFCSSYGTDECLNSNGTYQCKCSLGYEATNCDVANCSMGQCLNDGNCSITNNQWTCSCPEFYLGTRCEKRGACVDMPCVNGGTCSHGDKNGDTYSCSCAPGWKGVNCSEDVKECALDICQNGATCQELEGSYNCSCALGYADKNCSTDINECAPQPCLNGGSCSDLIGQYECNCTNTGFNGTNCETDVDECETIKCKNGGSCNNLIGNFNCTCDKGFVGKTCYASTPCAVGYCHNGGTCTFVLNDFLETVTQTCACTDGYEGTFCDKLTRPVEPEPDYTLAIILGPSIGGLVIVLLIGLLIFFVTARSKRATRGAYSPSHQEMSGSRVEMGHVLKPPPEERLI